MKPILSTWKVVGEYLGVSERTVRRYHRKERLPVHRVGLRGRIFALRDELDRWVRSKSPEIQGLGEKKDVETAPKQADMSGQMRTGV
jgi:excisionase family DNA binding protein